MLHDKLESGTGFRCKISHTEHFMKKGETENNEGKRQKSKMKADWEQGGANKDKEEQVLPCYKSGRERANITELLQENTQLLQEYTWQWTQDSKKKFIHYILAIIIT